MRVICLQSFSINRSFIFTLFNALPVVCVCGDEGFRIVTH